MEFNSNLLLHALSYVFFGLVESFDSLFGIFDLLLLSFSLKLDYFELIVELSIFIFVLYKRVPDINLSAVEL